MKSLNFLKKKIKYAIMTIKGKNFECYKSGDHREYFKKFSDQQCIQLFRRNCPDNIVALPY